MERTVLAPHNSDMTLTVFILLALQTLLVRCGYLTISNLTEAEANKPLYTDVQQFVGVPDPKTGDIVRNLDASQNPEEYGSYLEGDLLIPRTERSGLLSTSTRWPGAIIPFEINGNFTLAEYKIIISGIEHYHQHTCIKFVRRFRQRDYISIENFQAGCYTFAGRIGGKQLLNLQTPSCVRFGAVIHELMHVIGFRHEQKREDRDAYVTINWSNIPQQQRYNFMKVPANSSFNFGIRYTYNSIMHYARRAFAIDPTKDTIIPKMRNNETALMGQRRALTYQDLQRINRMYYCVDFYEYHNWISSKNV